MTPPDKINEIILSITNRCNLRCRMCQIPGRSPADEMATKDVKRLICDAAAFFPSGIVFSGGEPLLREDLFELIAFAGRRRLNTFLASNGTLIDDKTAQRLADAGIGAVNISIEGPEPVHERMRGRGNYARAVEALGHLARHRIETTIATTVCRENFRCLPDVMELAAKTGTTTVKFQPFSPIFLTDRSSAGDFFLPPQVRQEFDAVIEETIERARARRIATNPPAYLRSLSSYLCGLAPSTPPGHCAALWTSCPISAGGDVHACWVLADNIVGNVKKERLSKIWNSAAHDRMRRRILEKECTGCFMSCYDANFGGPGFADSLILKAGKLKKPKFFKRMYFRLFQRAHYLSAKALRRLRDLGSVKRRKGPSGAVLEAVRDARKVLEKKIESLP